MPNYNKQILERIVGTKGKGKGELAEKFKLAFAKKLGIKVEDMEKGIVDKVYNKEKVER
tara:strand:- start:982 stop:1158 length:177 start_codon:yes stop_codon:yes gene_type:complete